MIIEEDMTSKKVILKYLGIPNMKQHYRGDGLFFDAKDDEKNIGEVSQEKAKQLMSDFPDEWESVNGTTYSNKQIISAPGKKFQWTDSLRNSVVKMYLDQNPIPASSARIVSDIAVEIGASISTVRVVLLQKGVYIKKG